jgi:cell division protein FtsW (lipid II flippase)
MEPAVIGVFVPIVLFLVVGMVMVSALYFKYREKQLLIEKGLDAQSIKEFFENKKEHKDSNFLLKIGIIAIAFGIGLGAGMAMQDYTYKDYWVPFALFTFTGIGFVIANIAGKKIDAKDNKQ